MVWSFPLKSLFWNSRPILGPGQIDYSWSFGFSISSVVPRSDVQPNTAQDFFYYYLLNFPLVSFLINLGPSVSLILNVGMSVRRYRRPFGPIVPCFKAINFFDKELPGSNSYL